MKKFYEEDSSVGLGLGMVPKLKYEHLHINSFSAMRVDLAAQVQPGFSYDILLKTSTFYCRY